MTSLKIYAVLFIAAAAFAFLYLEQPTGAAPGCQKYMETAVRAALEADGQITHASRQAWATESLAWSAIYQNCMGKPTQR